VTAETIIQSLASGLLMGLLYGLIAVGLSLIFGLMDVGEFRPWRIPDDRDVCDVLFVRVLRHRSVAGSAAGRGALFVFGAAVYLFIVRFAVRAKGQCRHGADLLDLRACHRDAADWRNSSSRRTIAASPIHGSAAKLSRSRHLSAGAQTGWRAGVRSPRSPHCISSSTAPILAARLRPPARTPARWRLVGIDKNKVFALGWALAGHWLASPVRSWAMFFYVYPDVGASFALIAYVTVALGGFGSVFGAFAGGIVVGLVEAGTTLIPAAVAEIGRHLRGLSAGVFIRPRGLFGSIVMDTAFAKTPPPRPDRLPPVSR